MINISEGDVHQSSSHLLVHIDIILSDLRIWEFPNKFADIFGGTMNFLMRSTAHVSVDRSNIPSITESQTDMYNRSSSVSILESFASEDPYTWYSKIDETAGETSGVGGETGSTTGRTSKKELFKHSDVSEEEGWITIPYSMSSPMTHLVYNFILCMRTEIWM